MAPNAALSAASCEDRRAASDESIKLIRKLRWIGRDDDARQLERMLSEVPAMQRGSVLDEPSNTD